LDDLGFGVALFLLQPRIFPFWSGWEVFSLHKGYLGYFYE